MPSPTFVKIASTTLVSPATTFNFTDIPNTYYDLRLHFSCRSDVTGQISQDTALTLNGVATNSYVSVLLYNNSNTTSYGVANGLSGNGFGAANAVWSGGITPAGNSSINSFSNGQILIPGYRNTTNLNKARFAGTNFGNSSVGGGIIFYGIAGTRSAVTAAVNRVTIATTAGNFIAGSTISLYGCTNE
jgi:hypothetical protein